jgi:hypothetical protein
MIPDVNNAAELLSLVYVTVNALRVVFYVPQILAVSRCKASEDGNSLVTWAYFALSHWTAVAYFGFRQDDSLALLISLANATAVSVLTILLIARLRSTSKVVVNVC